MTRRRVAITGLGLVSPFEAGEDAQAFFAHLVQGKSAVRAWRPQPSFLDLDLPVVRCADFDATAARALLGTAAAHSMDRATQLACVAAESAWHDAGLPHALDDDARGGVCWGTSMGGIHSIEAAYDDVMAKGRRRVSPLLIVRGMHNAAAAHIAQRLSLGGPATTQSAACASSTLAIADGLRMVRDGVVDVALVGGAEAPLTAGTLLSWHAMQVLAPVGDDAATACRPFDARRTGLVLAEGAAALVLEDWAHAEARGARIFAELAGAGASCDHHHLTQPQARGQARALHAALRDAGLVEAEIDYVNAHATATIEGDRVEIESMRQVFGTGGAGPLVSATKSMHGHLLGATGALEALITVLALHRQAVPPTAHLREVDARCAGVRHVYEAVAQPLRAALSSSFAFGGTNAVLALRRAA